MRGAMLLVALCVLAGCGGAPTSAGDGAGGADGGVAPDATVVMAPDASACEVDQNGMPVSVCPVGAFSNCAPGEMVTPCCQGDSTILACSRPFGILSTECAANGLTCVSGLCAVDVPDGAIACCNTPGLQGPDPCGPLNCTMGPDGGISCQP
jgi:hypothetical protein